jgi:esterase FrsA
MSYTFPVDTDALFGERLPQWTNLGVPRADLDRVRAAVTTMWGSEPGCWTYELSALAEGYAARGDLYLASLAYGIAKFPVTADDAKRQALRLQVEHYVRAVPAFGLRFTRRVLELPYRGGRTTLPVHILSTAGELDGAPVLLFSGGLDSWKMDLHPLAAGFAVGAGVTVLAFDHPGTGECEVPLDAFADEVVLGLVDQARSLGNGTVAHFGLSFGGNFAALTGLSGAVDAAIDLGGPVTGSFAAGNLDGLMFGMADIGANAYGFTSRPPAGQLVSAGRSFDRAALLEADGNAPMLVVNGADDVHVVRADTEVFRGRRDTEVWLVPGTGHVAASKLPEVVPAMIEWLGKRLSS